MKKEIHPQYFSPATIKCACGKEYKVGSTKEKIGIEICSNCHPFFTGQEKLIDIAGRVEKFKAKREKATASKKSSKKKKR